MTAEPPDLAMVLQKVRLQPGTVLVPCLVLLAVLGWLAAAAGLRRARRTQSLLDGLDVGVGQVAADGHLVARNAWLAGRGAELAAAGPLVEGLDTTVQGAGGEELHVVVGRDTVLVHDVTELRRGQLRLRRSELRFRRTFESSPVGMALVSVGTEQVLSANAALARFLGTTAPGLVGRSLRSLLVDGEGWQDALGVSTAPVELRFTRADGSERWGAVAQALVEQDEGSDLLLLQVHDVDESVLTRLSVAHQATHDPLTGLANRRELLDHLEGVLSARRRAEDAAGEIGVLFVDLDGYKGINDSYGHEVGDEVLRTVARRLEGAVRGHDRVARLGGDEFVVVAGPPSDSTALVDMAGRVQAAVAAPMSAAGVRVRLTASVGVTLARAGASAVDVLREADAAMYRAKAAGGGRFEVYDAAMRDAVAEGVRVEGLLRDALSNGGVGVAYQPVVTLDGRLVGVEALARLATVEGEPVPPSAFIPLAEQSGLVVPLGLHVLEVAVSQAAHWHAGGTPLRTAVNVSARQLARGDLAATVLEALERHGLPPELLELEITETALIGAGPTTVKQVERLRERGVRIAIDDYGTGHASLAYLHRLPVSTLKIDASFVAGLPHDPRATAIVRAVAHLAGDVGVECVAEGVERSDQLDWLGEHTPQVLLQGFLLGAPAGASAIRVHRLPVPRQPRPRIALVRTTP